MLTAIFIGGFHGSGGVIVQNRWSTTATLGKARCVHDVEAAVSTGN